MEEDDIKIALRNLAQNNLILCDELLNLRASLTMIAVNVLGCPIEDVEEFIDSKAVTNERLTLGVEQLKKLDLDMTYNCNIYFFSSTRGLVTTSPRKLLSADSIYEGEDIVADIEQVIPELLLPLLYDSLKNPVLSLSKRINDAIGEVLTMLDIQKDSENG